MKNKVCMVVIIITVLMLAQFSMLIGCVNAETVTGSDGDVSWSFDSESGTLIFSGSGTITGDWRFEIDSFEEKVKKVVIQNGITTLEQFAFQNCKSIESIDIPNSVEVIEGNAFADCEGLTSITIPDKIGKESEEYISSWFINCESLENVKVSSNNDSYTSIDGVLYNKSKTKLIYYPINKADTSYKIIEGVTSIGDGAFVRCRNLVNIEIPNSVTIIGNSAFSGCRMTDFKIPNGVTSIEEYAFFYCQDLANIEIPSSVKSIGTDAFASCKNLKKVKISNGITSIGDNAFANCPSLTEIVIPHSVTTIGQNAFVQCENLTKAVIQNNETSISYPAFKGSDNLTIYCKSKSKAKQYAEENDIKYVIDDDAPTITTVKQEDKFINITATDNNGVGLADEAYSLDNKNWSSSNKLAVEKSGTYTVYVRDMLGNTGTKTIDVVIIEDSNKSDKDDKVSDGKENENNDKTLIETSNVEKNTEDKTQAKTVIPQAGTTFSIIILTAISIIGFVGYKKFKKIKY